ncbi:uncharacterized protein LOC107370139 [Tetranychus urticae]|uniref:Uncharacterized protein n=1 Tax=Tetranychus urticae TaxID=32264 RepID=T1L424_TETUR|nr:uncharacterized protein LOC107370139 [Tetranychus urticae]XP_015793609.1 uncharacterized protein LOC107370139 [Tetranychus urticae]
MVYLFEIFCILICGQILRSSGENIRLSSLDCQNYQNSSIIPIWQTPDQETILSEICDLVVILSGLKNDESDLNENSNTKSDIQLTNYRLELLLSSSPFNNEASGIADIYQTEEIVLPEESNVTSKGDLSINCSSKVKIQPVDLCGSIYIIINLKKVDRVVGIAIGSLSQEIEVKCPSDEKVSLRLQVKYENGSLVDTSVKNRLIIKTNGNSLEALNGIKFILTNNGYSSFRRRCGIKALQTIAFLLPVYRDPSSDFVEIDGKRFFNIANGYYLQNGDKLVREKRGFCSPFIQINSSVPVNITWFNLIGFTSLPSEFDLLIILDPFKIDETIQKSLEPSIFTFSLKLPADIGLLNTTKCTGLVVVYPANSCHILIVHSNGRSPRKINYFGYELLDKKLFLLESQQDTVKPSLTTTLVNKYFYQTWLIGQTVNVIGLYKQSCSINDKSISICEQIRILLFDISTVIGKIKVITPWEEEQVNKLILLSRVTSTLIKEIINGDLVSLFLPTIKIFRSLIVRSYSAADSLDKYDQTYFGTIQRVIEDIAESEPPASEAALIVPKRIRIFMGRLIREGPSAIISTLPNLKGKLSFLESLRQVIIWILEDVLWDFELPNEIKTMLVETINSLNPTIFQANVKKLVDLSESWSSIETDEEAIKSSTKLFYQLMFTTNKENIWSRYAQIWQLWLTRFMIDSQRWIFLEGLPNDPKNKVDSYYDIEIDDQCNRYAIQVLINNKIMPNWFQLDNLESIREKEISSSNQLAFKNTGDSILRGDWEILTGTIFWTRIMLCNCNKTLTDQCSL